ncbi:MAG: hydrolase TatD [Epulopiscium sp. Nuni2H_MBin003]|nr:MAG: hydrolase TatD [Epulopiscium sp. Nuni2H_MBin003]
MKIFETHAHYDDQRFDEDREQLIEHLFNNNIAYIMNVGSDIKNSIESIKLAKKYKNLYASVGVHPHEAEANRDLDILYELAKEEKVKAIGEIGLDFYYDHSPRDVQKESFIRQLHIAKKLDMPVIIHSRDADQETFDTLKDEDITDGVVHCFSGSKELANEYIKRGLYIGIGGALTFKNARKSVEVVQQIPIEKILIETDAPYLSPVPNRGKRNDSLNLIYVIEKIAEIKNMTQEEVAEITCENARRLYRI